MLSHAIALAVSASRQTLGARNNTKMAVTGGSSNEHRVHAMIRNPIPGNGLTKGSVNY